MRYVPMDGVVNRGERQFAFWDTVTDRFVSVAGEQSWCSVAELDASFDSLLADEDTRLREVADVEALRERLVGLARGNHALEETPPDEG